MLWICTGCSTAYSVDAPCCPHCGGKEYRPSAGSVWVGEAGPELAHLPASSVVTPKGRAPDA